jgi:hypothetical protein
MYVSKHTYLMQQKNAASVASLMAGGEVTEPDSGVA